MRDLDCLVYCKNEFLRSQLNQSAYISLEPLIMIVQQFSVEVLLICNAPRVETQRASCMYKLDEPQKTSWTNADHLRHRNQ
jgi:hypothetical protein